jgi:hypothetical protein
MTGAEVRLKALFALVFAPVFTLEITAMSIAPSSLLLNQPRLNHLILNHPHKTYYFFRSPLNSSRTIIFYFGKLRGSKGN